MAKKEITVEQFRSLIREEAMKYKKRTILEAEKKNLQSELKELMGEAYMEDGNIEELFGMKDKFAKAKDEILKPFLADIAAVNKLSQTADPRYADAANALRAKVIQAYKQIYPKYGIKGGEAGTVLWKQMIEPEIQPTKSGEQGSTASRLGGSQFHAGE